LLSAYTFACRAPQIEEVTCCKIPGRSQRASIRRSHQRSVNSAIGEYYDDNYVARGRYYNIRITGKMVRGLLKRGYLWPDERDDLNALRQAVILFMSDTLRKTPKPNRKTEDKEIIRTRPCAY
jgi:hypothetical protein